MIRAVIDTSTLISALGWEGKPQQILNCCLDKKFKLVISTEILEEVREVLFRKKFGFIDSDKLALKEYEGIKILSPSEFLGLLERKS